MKTKIALMLCLSTLVIAVSGCGNHADMAEVDTADTVDTTDMVDTEIQSDNAMTEDDIEASWSRFRDRALNHYGMTEEDAKALYQKIENSEILVGKNIEITGVALGDYDQNGQTDMIVCLCEDKENSNGYTDGCLYLFMNDEEPYYIYDDFCCYYFGNIFGDFGADVDHDGNIEIVFCVQGWGNGGAGDCEKFVIKHKDKEIERMELPNDLPDEYYNDRDSGLQIKIEKDGEKGVYNVYCPYFDETVALNIEDEKDWGGGANCRGYFMLAMTEYQGEEFLIGYEYIYSGYIANGLGSVAFVFDWDENGRAYVRNWYVEDWDGKIYLPSAKITEPLFDETQNSEEVKAYEEFLTGKLAAHIDDDIYAATSCRGITASHPEGMDKGGEGFYIEELINEIINEIVGHGINGIGSVQYALIDCGNDGKKQLALRAYGLGIYSRNDDSDCTMVFDYKERKVSMIYAVDSYLRLDIHYRWDSCN